MKDNRIGLKPLRLMKVYSHRDVDNVEKVINYTATKNLLKRYLELLTSYLKGT